MTKTERPTFVGEEWLLPRQGFSYRLAAPGNLADRTTDANEWIRLLALCERLKRGELDQDEALFNLVTASGNPELRVFGLRVLGHTASRDRRMALATFYDDPDEDTRIAAYEATLFACDLRLVEPLLSVYERSRGSERIMVMSVLSHLVEPEPDVVYDDNDELSADEYQWVVRRKVRELEARHGIQVAIFEASPLSVIQILGRIDTLCDEPDAIELSGSISRYVDFLEAMTGIPSVGVFEEGVTVNCHHARRVVSQCHRNGPERYHLGCRYFFGTALSS